MAEEMIYIPMRYRVDLDKTINTTPLNTLFAMGDNQAHRFELTITHGSVAVDLTGCTVKGKFVSFSNNMTVNLDGSVTGVNAVVTLTQACYAQLGRFALVIQIIKDSAKTSVFYGDGYMRSTSTENAIEGNYIVYDINALLSKIQEIENAISAANDATSSANAAASSANAWANATATATALAAGSAPTVSVGTSGGKKVLKLGIPKGDRGDKGEKGDKGDTGETGPTGKSGVAVSETEPTDPEITVWVKEDGSEDMALDATTLGGRGPDDYASAEAVGQLKGDLADLSDSINGIDTVLEIRKSDSDVPQTLTIVNGFYSGNIGDTATLGGTDTNWHSAVCELGNNDKIKVSLNSNNPATFGVIFTDANMKIISKELQGTNPPTVYTDEIVNIPNRATKVIICSFYVSAQKLSLSLIKIGSKDYSYNVINDLKNTVNSFVRMNYLYVSTNGSDINGDGSEQNPYATIYHANESIKDNSKNNRYTIIVKNGTYTDLQTRYAGNFTSTYEGVICKDYVYYESENVLRPDLCVISWDGSTGFTTPVTEQQIVDKCPFHITKDSLHTHIKGFTITCVNTRYAMHIEMAEATGESDWLIEHCIFNWGGRPQQEGYVTTAMIGCGTAFFEKGIIRNCVLNLTETGDTAYKNHMLIQTHDNNNNPSVAYNVGEHLIVENCKITEATTINAFATVNLRCNKKIYDVLPFCKFVNVIGKPIRLNLEGNASGQTYNVVFEATEKYTS